MRFKINYRIKQNDYLIAGKSAIEITETIFDALDKGDDFEIVVYAPLPLLKIQTIFRTVKTMISENLEVARFNDLAIKRRFGSGKRFFYDYGAKKISENELYVAERRLYRQIASDWLKKGVKIFSVDDVYIDYDVQIEKNCVIYPFNVLKGASVVKENTVLYWHNVISDSVIGRACVVRASHIFDSVVGDRCSIGPYAYLRQNALIRNDVRIGDFVEIKNSTLANGVKSAHLAYIGDAEVGENTNVGCGTVFANYDGKNKNKTTIGKNVFIGCNTNLIAPLNVGDGCFIAGGSTITEDLSEDSFAISRVKQTVKRKKQY